MDQNMSETVIKITDVRSSSDELQNLINHEVDIDESKEIDVIREYVVEVIEEETFSEEIDKEEIIQEQSIDVDDENTNNKKSKDSYKNLNFQFLNSKELEDCIVIEDESDDKALQNEDSHENDNYFIEVPPEIEASTIDEVELISGEEDNNSDDCIVITEHSSPRKDITGDMSNQTSFSNSDMTSESEKSTVESMEEEITEEHILREFDFTEEDDDICIVSEEPPISNKTVIRRTNLVYSCPLNCTFLAVNRMHMIKHLINHKKQSKLQEKPDLRCPLCSFTTFDKNLFVNHLVLEEEPRFACRKCSFVTPNYRIFKSHATTKHKTYLYCDNCSYKTKRSVNLTLHMNSCVNSRKKFKSKGSSQNEDDNFKCHFDPCPFTATSEESLKTHEWIQHQIGSKNIKKYQCYMDHCCFQTFREDLLNDHLKTHKGWKFKCNQCSYTSWNLRWFKDHVIRHVMNPDSKDYCGKVDWNTVLGQRRLVKE